MYKEIDFTTNKRIARNSIHSNDFDIETLTQVAESFAKSTYKSIHIIDYLRNDYIYISSNSIYLCNQTLEHINIQGFEFYSKYIPTEEQAIVLEINENWFNFLATQPIKERKSWLLTYDFHILTNGHKRLVSHTLSPLELTEEGEVKFAMCCISLSTRRNAGSAITRHAHTPDICYKYSLDARTWKKKERDLLSTEERNVLILSSQGYTMDEVANYMCKSIDTVKTYKRRIFEKLKVNNITRAIVCAINHKLL